jgi:hypothetical protein
MYFRISVFLLMTCSVPLARPAAGQPPDQASVVSIPLSSVSQMAMGFEFRLPANPYWKIRDESQHALVGKLVGVREKSPSDRWGATEFEIVAVHRTKNETWTKGMILVFPLRIKGQSGDLFGLFTSRQQDAWLIPEVLDESIANYLASIPNDLVERLHFFLRQIESKNSTVAFDAYTGLEQTPSKQLTSLRGRLPITQLRNRLLSFAIGSFDDEPKEVYSFHDQMGSHLLVTLARIVGASGTKEDADALEKHIRKQPCFRRDALTAAYLVLRGEAGMDRLEQDIKEQRAAKIGDAAEVLDLMAATELLCLYEENPIPRQRAIDLAVSSLRNPETAAGAIHALATWKEWEVMDQVTELFPPFLNNYTNTRRTIVFYLICCAEDMTSKYAGKASQILDDYKKQHPDLFKAAKSSFDSMGSAWHKRLAIEQSIGIGARLPGTPPTPPSMRVRTRRFVPSQ